MEQNRNKQSRSGREWWEDWDGQDSSIPEEPWEPDEIDILLHPELAEYRPSADADRPCADPAEPPPPDPPVPSGAEGPAHVPGPEDSGFYYKSGKPIPPTHPDHGPMHLLPRQEDGSFSAYYYCSKEELEAFDIASPPPRRQRRDGFSIERQQEFVERYRDTGSLTDAARLTGISRSTVYNVLNGPDGGALRAAIEEAGKGVEVILEATAFERAVNGQEEIVYHQGRRVGVRWKYDNKLLMQLLRARRPLQYAPLSEIEGWLKRRGIEPPADVEGALDRLAAAEAEWGRRLPGEGPAAPRFLPGTGRGIAGTAVEGAPRPTLIPATASNSSTSDGEDAATASSSSTSDGEDAASAAPILPGTGRGTAGTAVEGAPEPTQTPAVASSSSTSDGKDAALASSSSTSDGEDAALASSSSTSDGDEAAAAAAEPAVFRPPPRPRIILA